jgi:hypothetical protein
MLTELSVRDRYLQAQIYLLRPILAKIYTSCRHRPHDSDNEVLTMDGRLDNTLGHRTALQCSPLCVKLAIKLIEVGNEDLTTAEAWGQKPSWLYVVLHRFSSPTLGQDLLTLPNAGTWLFQMFTLLLRYS